MMRKSADAAPRSAPQTPSPGDVPVGRTQADHPTARRKPEGVVTYTATSGADVWPSRRAARSNGAKSPR